MVNTHIKDVAWPKGVSSIFLLLGLTAIIAAACSSGGGGSGSESSTGVSGNVEISGSSTVEPISVRVAELLEDVEPSIKVNVDGPGTGDGFKLFCIGKTDISGASRQIKDKEREECAENGISWIELKVAIDGIAVITSNENDSIDCVSFADIYSLTGPESQGFSKWSDGQDIANALGTKTQLPSDALDLFGPGQESGTYDSFEELVIEGLSEERGVASGIRPDYSSSADDSIILQNAARKKTSLAWVGYAYTLGSGASNLKRLAVDGGDGCVEADPENISSGAYPISRPLFIYVNADKAAESEALRTFVDFYLSENGLVDAVDSADYVQLPQDEKSATRENWDTRRVG